jgi:dTMP kinase
MRGLLVAFEGLDQSGKQTQTELLRDHLKSGGRKVRMLSFPDYGTSIGEEIARALQGERDYGPDVMQLLYIANRYERKDEILQWLDGGLIVICDRYRASSVAYGEAFGLDPAWLADAQKYLPAPDVTFLLDIAPETSARRKTSDRDKYERDLQMLSRVRDSYMRQAGDSWVRLDADRDRSSVARDVAAAVDALIVSDNSRVT